jgi:hypothetical protein
MDRKEGQAMNANAVVLQGTVKPDGTLELVGVEPRRGGSQ